MKGKFCMTMLFNAARKMGAVCVISIAATAPAFAGIAGPGPVVGAGIPALAAIGAGYWLIRKRRQR